MSKTRLYIKEATIAGGNVELRGNHARYIGRVLRLRPGDEITLFDGSGFESRAIIETSGKSAIGLSVVEKVECDLESPLQIHLLQGVSRGERMDFVIQKATELGVGRITPVLTEYSVVKLGPKRAGKRHTHWTGIAISACEQCGRNVVPVIDAPVTIRDWLGENHDKPQLRLIMKPDSTRTVGAVQPNGMDLAVLVGPEGGFSDDEYDLAEATGFKPLGLGPRILRTETAALAILASLQALYGDLA